MNHWNRNPVGSRCTVMARLLAVALTLALVLAGTPGTAVLAAGTAPEVTAEVQHYFRNGGNLFRLGAADLAECHRLLSGHAGTHSVTLARARFGDTDFSSLGGAPFVFEGSMQPDDVLLVGQSRSAVLSATGRDVEQAIDWDPVVTWTVSVTIDSVTSRIRRGTDQMSLTLPWELLDRAGPQAVDDPAAWLELNGLVTRLDSSSMTRIRTSTDRGESPPLAGLEGARGAAAEGFADLPGFVNAAQGFFIAGRSILRNNFRIPLEASTAGGSCVPSCLSCAGSLLTSTAAYIALVGTCGGALVTGGATALACIATFIGLQASHIAMLAACGKCSQCLEEPGCPCAGEPGCDCA